MIKKYLLCSLVFLGSFSSFACTVPRGERLTIGCSYHCDFIYRFRLRLTAIAAGYPIRFVNMRTYPEMEQAMGAVDAILIPGGADIDPEYYLDSVTPELADYTRENLHLVDYSREGTYRDDYEHSMVQKYSGDEKYETLPMLGICRGMQMMSVAKGIPLYLDIKTELGIRNRRHLFDRINVTDNDSLMSSFYGDLRRLGYKQHHQGIRMSYYLEHQAQYPLTRVTATSNNGTIAEALEYTHRPALGVQYHPEKSLSRTSFPIYRWFLTKACEHKNSKDNL
jgi:membrane dipeptidase